MLILVKAHKNARADANWVSNEKKTRKMSTTEIHALRLEHLVPLLSAPQAVHTLCVHLGGQQLVALSFFLRGTLVLDSLDFSLQKEC